METFISLNAATVTGPGASFELQEVHSNFVLQVTTSGSAGSYAVVYLEFSLDGVNWVSQPTVNNGSGAIHVGGEADGSISRMFIATGAPANYVRANCTTISSSTVTAIIMAA